MSRQRNSTAFGEKKAAKPALACSCTELQKASQMSVNSHFGLLICIFEWIIGQCGFIARVLHHIVPCDQSLANGCSPWLEALVGKKDTRNKTAEIDMIMLVEMYCIKAN